MGYDTTGLPGWQRSLVTDLPHHRHIVDGGNVFVATWNSYDVDGSSPSIQERKDLEGEQPATSLVYYEYRGHSLSKGHPYQFLSYMPLSARGSRTITNLRNPGRGDGGLVQGKTLNLLKVFLVIALSVSKGLTCVPKGLQLTLHDSLLCCCSVI